MAAYSRLKVLTTILETGLVPIYYHPDAEVAARVIAACAAGGARCFEFTNRGDGAHLVFQELVRHFQPGGEVILGAGTIVDAPTAALYIQLGANFIVGPNLDPEIARLCNRRKVAYSPGCGSASEVAQAEELGVEICKVFPGWAVGGPAFVKELLGPMPASRLMPTGGIALTQESLAGWIEAGAACVGMGGQLLDPAAIAAGDYAAITENVRRALGWVREARAGKPAIA